MNLKFRRKKKTESTSKLKARRPKKEKSKLPDLQHIFDLLQKKRLSWWSGYENASCLKCTSTCATMIRVGALVFCFDCFHTEFDSNAEVRNEEKYKQWQKYQIEVWDKWLDDEAKAKGGKIK